MRVGAKMKRRIVTGNIVIMAITVMLLASTILAGCGKKDSNEAGTENAETVTEEVKETAETETPTPEPTKEPSNDEANEDGETAEIMEPEASPGVLWEYVGYVDEAEDYLWKDEFVDRDFDGDGKNDRLLRDCDPERQLAFYTIELANKKSIKVPNAVDTGFPHIQSEDLDGDGDLEILFNLTFDTSTDPIMFGEMWLFDYDAKSDGYNEVPLPFSAGETGERNIHINYSKPVDGVITAEVKKYDFSAEIELDEDWISNWWTFDEAEADSMIWNVKIDEYEGDKAIYCEAEIMGRTGKVIGFWLVYEDEEYKVTGMDYSEFTHMNE